MLQCGKLLVLFATVAAIGGSAGAVTIKQLQPDESWADAHWTVTAFSDRIEVDLTKDFKVPNMVDSPLVLEFTLDGNDLNKDIHLVHGAGGEEVTNNTGLAWYDYHFVLVNSAAGMPSFLPQDPEARFTNLGNITSDRFSNVAADANQIHFTGGTVPDGNQVHFSQIRITHNGVNNGVFYLKEIPTPEPAALTLLAAGASVLLKRRRT